LSSTCTRYTCVRIDSVTCLTCNRWRITFIWSY